MPDFEFPLVIDALDDVPEPYRPLYEDKGEDGGIVLVTELAKKIGDQGSLTQSMVKERKRANEAEKALKAFQVVAKTPEELNGMLDGYRSIADTPERLKQLIDEKDALLADKPDVTKAVNQIRAAKDLEIQKIKGDLKRTREALQSEMVDTAVTAEIAKQKGFSRLLLPVVRNSVRIKEADGRFIREVVDQDGDPRINVKGEPMSLAELVAEAKADSELAYAFENEADERADPANDGGAKRSASKTYKLAQWQELVARATSKDRAGLLQKKARGEIRVVAN